MSYELWKWLHVLSSTVLFGTGLGSAYYLFFASHTRDPRVVASVAGLVVWADWLFTTTTIIFQPVSGWYLAKLAGFPLLSPWLMWTYALYLLAGACWLPVVWIQIRMRDMAREAASRGSDLPPLYWRYLRYWVLLGIPAFVGLLVVFYLMIAKPM